MTIIKLEIKNLFVIFLNNHQNLTNNQLNQLDSLFELVCQRQIKILGILVLGIKQTDH